MSTRRLGLPLALLGAFGFGAFGLGVATDAHAQGVYFSENAPIHHRDSDPVYHESPDAHRLQPYHYRYGYPVVVERRRVYRYPYPRDFYPPYVYDPGASIAAGIFGLAAGAVLGGVLAAPVQAAPVVPVRPRARVVYGSDQIAYCARKYRSFDPATFTYLGYDGRRHYCRIP